MSVSEAIIKKMQALTPEQQREVIAFVDALAKANQTKQPRKSLMGVFAGLNVHISEDDIAEARKEMWSNFPRDGNS